MSISDWEFLAVAKSVIATHGEHSRNYLAEQLAASALRGDQESLTIWRAVADRVVELLSPPLAEELLH